MAERQEREDRSWNLDELSARVALALSVDYDGQPSGRVRDVPDGRIVRYYTTLGLVDRPIRYEGRVAIYSTRHLLQIVAIKRLQQTGRSLAEIQQLFVKLDERALAKLAAVPQPEAEGRGWGSGGEAPGNQEATSRVPAMRREPPAPRDQPAPEEEVKEKKKEEESRERFWNAAPAPAVTDARIVSQKKRITAREADADARRTTLPGTSEGRRAPRSGSAAPLTGVPISEQAVLLAQFARELDDADMDAIRAAAAPLLAELAKRGLL